MTAPVLLTAFNRPVETARVLDAIRGYAPTQLFLAVDGPRAGVPGETESCAEVVRVLEGVDWTCEVERLVRNENLGCRRAMEGAIDWFFEHVPEGIILEDDCLPSPDFFRLCDVLLDTYRDDQAVGMICGTNVLGEWRPSGASYFFGVGAVWGWASWRRAWGRAADHLVALGSPDACATAERLLGSARWRTLHTRLRAVARGELDTWDYPWVFALAARGQLAVLPAVNLVTNIGFGPGATHTVAEGGALDGLAVLELEDPIRPADQVVFDREFDARWQALEAPRWRRWLRWPARAVGGHQ
jgi:hypothetical protein